MYFNRDISWLSFNYTVLQQANNNNIPLMERIKFLSIFSSNLDEFFRVRFPLMSLYANLKTKLRTKIDEAADPAVIDEVQQIIANQSQEFGSIIQHNILPQLQQNNIHLYYNTPIPTEFEEELKDFFYTKILSFIQPIIITKSLKESFFPVSNKLYLIVTLLNKQEEKFTHAFVNIPSDKVGRFHSITKNNEQHIFFIDDIIRKNLSYIFSNYEIKSCYSFKITRDADLNFDEENIQENLLQELEKKILKRDNGHASRLLYQFDMPLTMQKLLANAFDLSDKQLFEGGVYHNLVELGSLPITQSSLLFAKQQPLKHKYLNNYADMFKKIEEQDLLFHFPYHSYNPVLSFFNQAAIDANVKSIYVTLYRVANDSFIANALVSAAKNGKNVFVFVELKARFDEANNIQWVKRMEEAGVKIIYGIPGIKVHSKIALIKKKKNATDDVDYAFIGTGNFNESTARFYTDHALFTAHKGITKDLENLFSALQKKSLPKEKKFNHLLVAQNNMVDELEKQIKKQIKNKQNGLPASIKIKVNNLEDVGMINLLYKASEAGVNVQLIVRSICCIVPQKLQLSENITVKRIVDRYLEHTRIFIFGDGADKKVMIGSADLMTRNLYKRIEVITPVYHKEIANELEDYFNIQWQDDLQAYTINEQLKFETKGYYNSNNQLSAQQKIYSLLNVSL